MPYYTMLKLDALPQEEYAMLKQFVEKYNLQGPPSQTYSDMFGILIHLACEVLAMRSTTVDNGQEYIASIVRQYLDGR